MFGIQGPTWNELIGTAGVSISGHHLPHLKRIEFGLAELGRDREAARRRSVSWYLRATHLQRSTLDKACSALYPTLPRCVADIGRETGRYLRRRCTRKHAGRPASLAPTCGSGASGAAGQSKARVVSHFSWSSCREGLRGRRTEARLPDRARRTVGRLRAPDAATRTHASLTIPARPAVGVPIPELFPLQCHAHRGQWAF